MKLLAGVGAWVGGTVTLYAFCVSALVGGVIAIAMLLCGEVASHLHQFTAILTEILVVRDPSQLAVTASHAKAR